MDYGDASQPLLSGDHDDEVKLADYVQETEQSTINPNERLNTDAVMKISEGLKLKFD